MPGGKTGHAGPWTMTHTKEWSVIPSPEKSYTALPTRSTVQCRQQWYLGMRLPQSFNEVLSFKESSACEITESEGVTRYHLRKDSLAADLKLLNETPRELSESIISLVSSV